MADRVELSVIIPFLDEEQALPILKERFEGLKGLPRELEIILINDGSKDGGPAFIERWAKKDPRVKLVGFSRNFGHQIAISAGLDFAKGDYVGIMDADLQDPPEVLLQLYEEAVNGGYDIVYSIREKREAVWYKRAAYNLFYSLYAYFAESPVNIGSGDFCVMSRRTVDALLAMPEKVRFVRGLRSWLGLREKGIPTTRPERAAGTPKYSLRKLLFLAVNGITSFSVKPLRLATMLGLLLSGGSLLLGLIYLALALLMDLHERVPGFATLVLLILFFNGLQFLMIGILGEYIGRIFWEVKRRPLYIVDKKVNIA